MTIDTWTAGLSGRTSQSKRGSGEAANADRPLEEDSLRIVVRMPGDERDRACREQQGEDRLHRGMLAEFARPATEPGREHRPKPAAEGTGEDVERPMHADHCSRN